MHPFHWFADLRIRHKLLLVYSLLFLLSFSLAGGVMYIFVKNHIQSSIEQELKRTWTSRPTFIPCSRKDA